VLSESARMTTAAELRFRVQAPNAKVRATTVIALDPASEPFVGRLAEEQWNHATFLKASSVAAGDPGASANDADASLTAFDGRPTRVRDEVNAADQVIMVASAGGRADAAAAIGRACSDRRVTTTALIVGAADASDVEISKTLAQLRPWSLMVVIANSDDYVTDMMTALRV
jgi:hypothetical protein